MSVTGLIAELAGHPEKLDDSVLEILSDAVAHYPFFGVARILYLAALRCTCSPDYHAECGKAVLFLPDSYDIQKSVDTVLSARESARMRSDRTMCALNDFLGDMPDDAILLPDMPETTDYLSAVGMDATTDVKDTKFSESDRVIASFLSDGGAAAGITEKMLKPEPEQDEETDVPQPVDENLFTETLADIYIRQHRYVEAIEIIRYLYLNFPNKSCYFADQIRFLETLLKLNKQKDK